MSFIERLRRASNQEHNSEPIRYYATGKDLVIPSSELPPFGTEIKPIPDRLTGTIVIHTVRMRFNNPETRNRYMQLIIDMSELPDSVSGIISKKLQREKEEGYRPCFDQTNLTAEMPPYIRGVSGKITAVLFDKPLDRIGRKYDPGPEGPVDAILKTAHPHKPISEQPVTPAQARAEFLDTIRTTTSRYLGMLASLKALDDEEKFQKIFGSDD